VHLVGKAAIAMVATLAISACSPRGSVQRAQPPGQVMVRAGQPVKLVDAAHGLTLTAPQDALPPGPLVVAGPNQATSVPAEAHQAVSVAAGAAGIRRSSRYLAGGDHRLFRP